MQANIKGTQYCPLPVAKKIRLLKGPLKKWTEPYMKFQKGSKKNRFSFNQSQDPLEILLVHIQILL